MGEWRDRTLTIFWGTRHWNYIGPTESTEKAEKEKISKNLENFAVEIERSGESKKLYREGAKMQPRDKKPASWGRKSSTKKRHEPVSQSEHLERVRKFTPRKTPGLHLRDRKKERFSKRKSGPRG